jgi:hypothetical protein
MALRPEGVNFLVVGRGLNSAQSVSDPTLTL